MASLGLAFCVVFLFVVCFSVGIGFVYLYSLESLFWWLFFFFFKYIQPYKKWASVLFICTPLSHYFGGSFFFKIYSAL